MIYLLKIIRILLLLFSLYGYSQELRCKINLKAELVLPVLFASIGSIMFLAGILNILAETSIVFFAVGLILGFISIYRKDKPSSLITLGTVICAIIIAVLLALTYSNKYLDYDNFSHWGTVVRLVVEKDAFPNFEDSIIVFQSYPTGSAAFIYYFAKITGLRSEWFYLWTQEVLTVCMAGSILAFCSRKYKLEYLGAAACVVFILCSLVKTTQMLLVDTLLSVVGISGIAVCFYYREIILSKKLLLLPILVFSVSIKNSGIFFAVIILAYYLYRIIKNRNAKIYNLWREILFTASPFIVLLLWDKHVSYVFSKGMTAKHSMPPEYYEEIISQKTPEIISQITDSFIKKVFSLHNSFWLAVCFIILVAVICAIWRIKSKIFAEGTVLIFASYLIYQAGNYMMYLFSMPNNEALQLASYERYHGTFLIFACGILWIIILSLAKSIRLKNEQRSEHYHSAVCIAHISVLVFFSWFFLSPRLAYFERQKYDGTERQLLDSIVETYQLDTSGNTNYILLWEQDNVGYRSYLSKYVFNDGDILFIEENNIEQLNNIEGYDYLIIPEHTEIIDKYLRKTFGSDTEEAYKITRNT